MKDFDWIKELVFMAVDVHDNVIYWCQREGDIDEFNQQ